MSRGERIATVTDDGFAILVGTKLDRSCDIAAPDGRFALIGEIDEFPDISQPDTLTYHVRGFVGANRRGDILLATKIRRNDEYGLVLLRRTNAPERQHID